MKTARKIFASLFIVSFIFLVACPPDDNKQQLTAQQEKVKSLTGTWSNASSVSVPTGIDAAILDQLTMTFNSDADYNATTFSSSGASEFFSSQSSSGWSLSGSDYSVIVLTNVTPVTQMSIVSLSESQLTINFTHPGARMARLDGDYQVTLSR
jgi:hypothetical protein